MTNKRLIVEGEEPILLEEIEEAYTTVDWAGLASLSLRLKNGTEQKFNVRTQRTLGKFLLADLDSTCIDKKATTDRWVNAINNLKRQHEF